VRSARQADLSRALVKIQHQAYSITRAARTFVREEEGGALVEYGILIALIVTVCVIVVAVMGNKTSKMYSEMNARFF
jgi:Flp pilus assembly pilin Flp